jgi:hypothetical protein
MFRPRDNSTDLAGCLWLRNMRLSLRHHPSIYEPGPSFLPNNGLHATGAMMAGPSFVTNEVGNSEMQMAISSISLGKSTQSATANTYESNSPYISAAKVRAKTEDTRSPLPTSTLNQLATFRAFVFRPRSTSRRPAHHTRTRVFGSLRTISMQDDGHAVTNHWPSRINAGPFATLPATI